ncbi:MAG: UPF0149 family protein [Pseudomonadales bacterium]|nr:UPF0149 family protein [Pseudomonadales bacterium]
MPPLDWDETAASLASDQPWITPGELHGLLCGCICALGRTPDDDSWLQYLWQHAGEDPGLELDHPTLARFRSDAARALYADDFAFQPLLPDEDQALADRLAALGGFCSGFLSGFGLAGGSLEGLEEDAVTALRDLAAITQVEADVDGAEDEEQDFTELTEYVRMAVLLILAARDALEDADQERPEGNA